VAVYEVKDFVDIQDMVMEELKIQSSDDTSRDRIKRDINAVYLNEVVPFKRWYWLMGRTQLKTVAYIADGTVSVTPNSTTITFSTAPVNSVKNYWFATDTYNEIYRISAHTAGATTATLESAFTGDLDAEAAYKVWTDRLALPTDLAETVEIYNNFLSQPMEAKGLQDFRRCVAENPRLQARPRYYTTYDFFDPTPDDDETESDRYRLLMFYPAVLDSATTIHVDYIKEVDPLELDGDEPLMPVRDRMILVYGALARAWSRERNPEEATRNERLFKEKLGRMAGSVEDSRDTPQIVPSSRYLEKRRGGSINKLRYAPGDGGSYSAPSYLQNVRIDGATIVANVTVNAGVTIDGRDISVDGATLDSLGALFENIETANRVVVTDSSAALEESVITSTELTYLDDVEALTSKALEDNTNDAEVATWAHASFDNIKVDYSIKRGSANKQSGRIEIVTDGTSAAIAEGGIASLGTLGVTFTVDVSGTDVRLLYTTTSTGSAATMKYRVQKWLA
jgi:hypothetical protein